MGVIHVPKRKREFSNSTNNEKNETTFLAFGGMAFTEQVVDDKAFLLTLNHITHSV